MLINDALRRFTFHKNDGEKFSLSHDPWLRVQPFCVVVSFPLNGSECTHAECKQECARTDQEKTKQSTLACSERQWVHAMSWKASVPSPGHSLPKEHFLVFHFHFELPLIGHPSSSVSFQVVH